MKRVDDAGPTWTDTTPAHITRNRGNSTMARISGTVKWFNDDKGFGFISPNGGGRDAFVHFSAIDMQGRKTLVEGQRVEYEIEQAEKGPAAINVRSLDG